MDTYEMMLLTAIVLPLAGAVLSCFVNRAEKSRKYLAAGAIVFTAAELLLWVCIAILSPLGAVVKLAGLGGLGLSFTLDGFRLIQGVLAAFLWFGTGIFSKEYMQKRNHTGRYYLFFLLTQGAVMGVFLSADLFTTFLFFEMMSFTSFVFVAQEEKKESLKEAELYLAIAILGGLVMLMGLFVLYNQLGTLRIDQLSEAVIKAAGGAGMAELLTAGVCLLFGFGAKAGIFLLHIWMPGSYTQAPAPESALLSGILSKTGIYGMIVITAELFSGGETGSIWGRLIMVLGLLTMVCGAFFALCSVNIKKLLAYSSMSQIGFIFTGIGMAALLGEEGVLSAGGTVLHMMNHSLIKLVLFCIAGIVFMNLGSLDLNEIRGFGRKKFFLKAAMLASVLGIGGIPLFNGYISKTLLHESILEGIRLGVLQGNFLNVSEWIFIISGGFTLAYMCKLFAALCIEKNKDAGKQKEYDEKTGYAGRPVKAVLGLTCMSFLAFGMLPAIFSDKLAGLGSDIFGLTGAYTGTAYFRWENLRGALLSVIIGAVLYAGVRIGLMKENRYIEVWPSWLTLQKVLYYPLKQAFVGAGFFFARCCDSIVDIPVVLIRGTILKDAPLPGELEEGTRATYITGKVFDKIRNSFCKITKRRKKDSVSYVHKCAVKYTELMENQIIISRSLSFGLLMFCLGLSLTLIYVVFW